MVIFHNYVNVYQRVFTNIWGPESTFSVDPSASWSKTWVAKLGIIINPSIHIIIDIYIYIDLYNFIQFDTILYIHNEDSDSGTDDHFKIDISWPWHVLSSRQMMHDAPNE